jgi:poly-gamma-glutamate synthesis protein (capsule biosynthesis protein)
MLFLGDVMLSRGVSYQISKNNDLYYPFHSIQTLLRQNDFVFSNFESPIISGRQIHTGEMAFRVDENLAPILKELNFSILSLANNHLLDFGQKGLLNTLKLLAENQIQYIGAGENRQEAHRAKILEKNNIKIAFLAYNDSDVILATNEATENRPGTAFMDLNALKKDLAETKKSADFTIVSMHSGTEYKENPNSRQIEFAHTAIDNGANLVIGHHPHVVQPIEKYKNGYIFYSLGNFIFDQAWSQETTEGIATQIIFSKNEIRNIKILPLIIENYSQPKIISRVDDTETFQKIINRLNLPVDPIFSF